MSKIWKNLNKIIENSILKLSRMCVMFQEDMEKICK